VKRVFIAGNAYSTRFFELALESDEELSLMPSIAIARYHAARFALVMQDRGLAGLGIFPIWQHSAQRGAPAKSLSIPAWQRTDRHFFAKPCRDAISVPG